MGEDGRGNPEVEAGVQRPGTPTQSLPAEDRVLECHCRGDLPRVAQAEGVGTQKHEGRQPSADQGERGVVEGT